MPGTKSNRIVRWTWAVPPVGLTATMLSTLVPPVIGTSMLKEPSEAAGAETTVVAELASVFVAATYTVLPAAVVPLTVTGEPVTEAWSSGLVTVRLVLPWLCATYRACVTAGSATLRFAARSAVSRTNDAADQVSGDADPAAWPFAKPIEASVGSVP